MEMETADGGGSGGGATARAARDARLLDVVAAVIVVRGALGKVQASCAHAAYGGGIAVGRRHASGGGRARDHEPNVATK